MRQTITVTRAETSVTSSAFFFLHVAAMPALTEDFPPTFGKRETLSAAPDLLVR
jgi:hypothetical protein